nr:hypothetical protein Iba_scaffold65060CG0010 [Ipomoea batatas]
MQSIGSEDQPPQVPDLFSQRKLTARRPSSRISERFGISQTMDIRRYLGVSTINGICNEIERKIRHFLWSGGKGGRHLHLVRWDKFLLHSKLSNAMEGIDGERYQGWYLDRKASGFVAQ